MRFFSGHGEEALDTRRMSVLESIPLCRLEELKECLELLCTCFDLFDNDAEATNKRSEWQMAHSSVRNRGHEAPADYAEAVFGVYKKVVLESSHYFSICRIGVIELFLDAKLASMPLVICILLKRVLLIP